MPDPGELGENMDLGQLPASDYNEVQGRAGSELEPAAGFGIKNVDVHLGPVRDWLGNGEQVFNLTVLKM